MMALDALPTADAPTTPVAAGGGHRRGWAVALARRYARHTARTRFDGVFVSGLDATRALCRSGPVLLACNHVCWWDTFALVLVDEAIGTTGAALMDERNLARLPFFRSLGAMPIDTAGGPRVRRQLHDAAAWLTAPGRTMWLFPQGRQRAWHLRPLGFHNGLRLLARRAGVPVVPVSLAYPWREAPVPSLVVTLHAPIAPDADVVARAEDVVTAGLDAIDAAIDGGDTAALGGVVVPPRADRGAQDGLGSRLLRRMMGGTP